jgi:hypothetical protein
LYRFFVDHKKSIRDHELSLDDTARSSDIKSTSCLPEGLDLSESTGENNTKYNKDAPDSKEPCSALTKRTWVWKNAEGSWVQYPDSVNDTINKNYDKNPQSTVLVSFDGQRYI